MDRGAAFPASVYFGNCLNKAPFSSNGLLPDNNSPQMRYLRLVSMFDLRFGVLPLIGTIMRITSDRRQKPRIEDFCFHVRRLWILQQISSLHNENLEKIPINDVTRPESLFLPKSIEGHYLEPSYSTKAVLESLLEDGHISSYYSHKHGDYVVTAGKTIKEQKLAFEKEIYRNYISRYDESCSNTEIEYYKNNETLAEIVSAQIGYTRILLDHFLSKNILDCVDVDPRQREYLKQFCNLLNFPIVGVNRVKGEPSRIVLYLLSLFEYGGERKLESLHMALGRTLGRFFENNPVIVSCLEKILRLNEKTENYCTESRCYAKRMTGRPISQEFDPKTVCTFTMVAWTRDITTRSGFKNLPFGNSAVDLGRLNWEYHCPIFGDDMAIEDRKAKSGVMK